MRVTYKDADGQATEIDVSDELGRELKSFEKQAMNGGTNGGEKQSQSSK